MSAAVAEYHTPEHHKTLIRNLHFDRAEELISSARSSLNLAWAERKKALPLGELRKNTAMMRADQLEQMAADLREMAGA